MKIIVPMAGRGKRMRPHTLTVPKPLIPVAGKPIVQRLVEDIAAVCDEAIDEIAFIIGDFGEAVEKELIEVAESLGARGSIYHQEVALGTAHAILCAKESLDGKVIVAFADTLFRADFELDSNAEGTIWVNQIDDPSQFGVVKVNDEGHITDFVEKPAEFVSDLAIIGIYYFRDGANLRRELQHLIDNDIKDRGEYQITDALENMKNKGLKFKPGKVTEWLDCGNKNATVYTNQRVLENKKQAFAAIPETAQIVNSLIIPPCFIGEHAVLENAVIGPHVSVGAHTHIRNAVIRNSIVQKKVRVENRVMADSMIGNEARVLGRPDDLSVGDFNVIE